MSKFVWLWQRKVRLLKSILYRDVALRIIASCSAAERAFGDWWSGSPGAALTRSSTKSPAVGCVLSMRLSLLWPGNDPGAAGRLPVL